MIKKHEAGGGVAVKIEHAAYESAKQFGRHCMCLSLSFPFMGTDQMIAVDDSDELISMVSRVSIDTMKEHFRDDTYVPSFSPCLTMRLSSDAYNPAAPRTTGC